MDSIRIRRDTRASYELVNPYLELGEFAIVKDEFPTPVRIGDGEHRWAELQEQYFSKLNEEQRQQIIKALSEKIDKLEKDIKTVDEKMVVMTEREYDMLRYKDPDKFYFLYTGEGPTQYSYLDSEGYLHVYGTLTGNTLSVNGTIRNKVLNLE